MNRVVWLIHDHGLVIRQRLEVAERKLKKAREKLAEVPEYTGPPVRAGGPLPLRTVQPARLPVADDRRRRPVG